jgi:hypothetical protein
MRDVADRLAHLLPENDLTAFCHRWRVHELALFGSVLRTETSEMTGRPGGHEMRQHLTAVSFYTRPPIDTRAGIIRQRSGEHRHRPKRLSHGICAIEARCFVCGWEMTTVSTSVRFGSRSQPRNSSRLRPLRDKAVASAGQSAMSGGPPRKSSGSTE